MTQDEALPPAWLTALQLPRDAVRSVDALVAAEEDAGRTVHPPRGQRFVALRLTDPAAVRVAILGQDPYHGPGQAHGLAFSVPPGIRMPPSLINIYKELATDLGIARPAHGTLEAWARQGVLLLNTTLTVEDGRAASHQHLGWQAVTDAIVDVVARATAPSVFVLWGSHAQKHAPRIAAIGQGRHLILASAHPSPLSARRGFFGSRPFSRANAFLQAHGRGVIDWHT